MKSKPIYLFIIVLLLRISLLSYSNDKNQSFTFDYYFLNHNELDIDQIKINYELSNKNWLYNFSINRPIFQLKRELEPTLLRFKFIETKIDLLRKINRFNLFKLYYGGKINFNYGQNIAVDFLEFEKDGENVLVTITDELKAQGKHAVTSLMWDLSGGPVFYVNHKLAKLIIETGSEFTGGYIKSSFYGGTPTIDSEILKDKPFLFMNIDPFINFDYKINKYLGFLISYQSKFLIYDEDKFDIHATSLQLKHFSHVIRPVIYGKLTESINIHAGMILSNNFLLGESMSLMNSYTLKKYDSTIYRIIFGVTILI
jgi:hypothetical protein